MGYTTKFAGILKFTAPLDADQREMLESMLGEDCREHPEWNAGRELTYIDLEVSKDGSGLEWDGAEKTYHMEELVNLVIVRMRQSFPRSNFGLIGELLAQGEEVGDIWRLTIGADGTAKRTPVVFKGDDR